MKEFAQFICLGMSALDFVWTVPNLPRTGVKTMADGYACRSGGMAATAAVTIAKLGGDVAFWGRAGEDDAGRTLQKRLAEQGVQIGSFRLFPKAKTPVAGVIVDHEGERQITTFRGEGLPDATDWLPMQEVERAKSVLADIRWGEGVISLFRAARAAGVPTVLDIEAAPAQEILEFLPLTDHAIFSEPGLQSFAPDASINEALMLAREKGCGIAGVTCGARGVHWHDADGAYHCPAFKTLVVDSTGAGDVFHGAYAYAIGMGQPVDLAMRVAAAAAAHKCASPMGQSGIPTMIEIEAFLEKNK